MIHLRAVDFRSPTLEQAARFPFTVAAIAALVGTRWTFATPVTMLVGENGSGKSTLMESLAVAIGSITVGSAQAEHDQSLRLLHPLADSLKLIWSRKTRRGFFLRSEDFFGYARRQHEMREEFEAEIRNIDADPTLSDAARGFAKLPYGRELGDMRRHYGEGLDVVSHGESFLALFQSRFVPNGLYLLDEPEAPLSPMRQLALISLIKHSVAEQGAQFIIATHSPILLAIPDATILAFSETGVQQVAYEETEHVRLTRDFLNHPEQFLRHL
jgi:predicted ATPase